MIIYYNPDCSKCREAREILEGENCSFELRNYLEIPPTKKEIEELIALLGCKAEDLVRKTDPFFLENFSEKNFLIRKKCYSHFFLTIRSPKN